MQVDQTGTATLRRDGFAGLSTKSTAVISTRPLIWDGHLRHLFVNVRGGSIRVAVTDLEGKAIPQDRKSTRLHSSHW